LDGKFDRRVPFLLKFAGQKQGLLYAAQFNTLGSQDLLLAVLRGEVADAAAASQWLDAHGPSIPNPYAHQ
jgi:hypothetical protein